MQKPGGQKYLFINRICETHLFLLKVLSLLLSKHPEVRLEMLVLQGQNTLDFIHRRVGTRKVYEMYAFCVLRLQYVSQNI